VGGAVRSAVAQTITDIEIIVVVDGPDPETEAVLASIEDARLRILVRPETSGGPAGRNAGIGQATGTFVALLDDDDRWAPTKLERQLEAIGDSGVDEPLGFSARLVEMPDGRLVAWHDRAPGPHEHPSEYLFVRRSLRLGESTVSTSTIVARRTLFMAVPFDPAVTRYEDADWVLRAVAAGARLVYSPERLSIWRAPVDGASVTGRTAADWRYGVHWIQARRDLVTPRAYAAFLLVRVAAMADRAGERRAAGILWREARRYGRPGLLDVTLFAGRWIVPDRLRHAIRTRLASAPHDSEPVADQG
jgi:glycosyltransferase involved in cell wall biosynthesis